MPKQRKGRIVPWSIISVIPCSSVVLFDIFETATLDRCRMKIVRSIFNMTDFVLIFVFHRHFQMTFYLSHSKAFKLFLKGIFTLRATIFSTFLKILFIGSRLTIKSQFINNQKKNKWQQYTNHVHNLATQTLRLWKNKLLMKKLHSIEFHPSYTEMIIVKLNTKTCFYIYFYFFQSSYFVSN